MLELKNISLSKPNGKGCVEILKDINLTLESHRLYVLTGPNGGGKSSLAKVIMGVYQPTSGQIILDGEDITSFDIARRAKMGIGYAFQQPPRFKGMTVRELLDLARGSKETRSTCNYLFEVGLCPPDYLDREIDENLSGGEMKRIELATLLNRQLKLALFDEPEAGIDLWSFRKLTETFRNMHNAWEATTVIISHQERIMDLADKIIIIAEGQVQERGQKEDLLPQIIEMRPCKCDCPQREKRLAERE